jgi:DNA-binding transcriptional regulator YiaG
MTVVETETFLERAKTILTESDRAGLVHYLASNPEAGQLIPGTGGARKIRWALPGRGKRGGARTIYYYHNESIPLFILDIYTKNQKSDLSEADKHSLKWILSQIPSRYAERS